MPSPAGQPTLTTLRNDAVELPSLEIVVSTPGTPPRQVPLGVEPLVVGTSLDCDIIVADPRISRRHCQVTLSERGIVLKDLGSKNGTSLEGIPILEALLLTGATARVGNSTLVVRVLGQTSVVPLSTSARFGEALGGSLAMRALFARLERAAPTAETILLLGESGTGKELLARAIHEASPRSSGPFVVFDCSAVAPTLVEAELFGHTKGAFTGAQKPRAGLFEEANGGTLFIDEVGELPLEIQPKLLRALESRQTRRLGATTGYTPFDARIVAATHRDLPGRVTTGAFREDLYYRLAVVEATIPPLRDRKEDIPLIVGRFLATQVPSRTLADLPANTLELLKAHHWPGNVRELRNTVARLLLFPHLGDQAILKSPARAEEAEFSRLTAMQIRDAREVVIEQFERAYLGAKLREHDGNVARVATAIGVSRQFVYRMMERYGIRSTD